MSEHRTESRTARLSTTSQRGSACFRRWPIRRTARLGSDDECLVKQGPQGRPAWPARYVASLPLRFWTEFRGNPPQEPPICFRRKRKKEKGQLKRRKQGQNGTCPVMPLRPTHGVALPFPCRFSLSLSASCVGACLTGLASGARRLAARRSLHVRVDDDEAPWTGCGEGSS